MVNLFPKPPHDRTEFDEFLEFFRLHLRSERDFNLDKEYPLVFAPKNRQGVFAIRPNDKIEAGLATLVREIEVSQGEKAKVLFVGSVVTDPTHRMKGHQRVLFHRVEEYAEEENVDLIVLWSNQTDFYFRLGFFLGGLQASWISTHPRPLSKSNLAQINKSGEIELTQKHYNAFCEKRCRVDRTFDEMKQLWKIPEMRIAHTENAYALLGKGEDFQGICHEWAGPADEVLACFDLLRNEKSGLRILSPGVVHSPNELEVIESLDNHLFESSLEYLGLFKILNKKWKKEDFLPETLKAPFFIWGLDSI